MKPALWDSLKAYRKKDVLSDLIAGLTVAIVALPLSVALGIQSGEGATLHMGIWAAIIGGLLIAAFGGNRTTIGGPSAAFIALTAGMLANTNIGMDGMLLSVIFAGVILVIAGFCKAGKGLGMMPNTIIVGLTAGLGVILLFTQFKEFFGLSMPPLDYDAPLTRVSPFIAGIISLIQGFGSFGVLNLIPLGIAVFALILVFVLPKINKKIPAVTVSVLLATILTVILQAAFKSDLGISTVGSIASGAPEITFISFRNINPQIHLIIVPAFTIALVSALEALTTANMSESATGKKFNANMEIVGSGIANIGAGFFGSLPVTGTLARTKINIDSGAKTPLAGIFHALILLILYVALMPVMIYIPFAALSGVLIKVSINMCRFKLFGHYMKFGKRDCAILLTTFLLTVFLGVLWGVLAGVALALVINAKYFKHRMVITDINIADVKNCSKIHKSENDENGENAVRTAAIKVCGSVFFANIEKLIAAIRAAAEHHDEIVIDLEGIAQIDATSVYRLAKLTSAFSKRDKRLVLHNLCPCVYKRYITSLELIYSFK
ncbi:MAG: SulP family inorganic anion transporter [Firmicutes bacterium]|nr:SulP family inorganic anion transporter [Bacillota bacterium]